MKEIIILVSDEVFEKIQQIGDKHLKGRLWLEDANGVGQLRFEHYKLQATRHTKNILCRLPFGWLIETAQQLQLQLSTPKAVGKHAAATLLLGDAKVSADVLHHLADAEMDNEHQNPKEDGNI